MAEINDNIKQLIDKLENLQYNTETNITEIETTKNNYRIADYNKFQELIDLLNNIKIYLEKINNNLEKGLTAQSRVIEDLRESISRLVRDPLVSQQLLNELDNIKNIGEELKKIKFQNYDFEYEISRSEPIRITESSRFSEPQQSLSVFPPQPPEIKPKMRETTKPIPETKPRWNSSTTTPKLFSDFSNARPQTAPQVRTSWSPTLKSPNFSSSIQSHSYLRGGVRITKKNKKRKTIKIIKTKINKQKYKNKRTRKSKIKQKIIKISKTYKK